MCTPSSPWDDNDEQGIVALLALGPAALYLRPNLNKQIDYDMSKV